MLACLRPWSTLTHCHGYDINCQYRKKYKQRLQDLMKQYPALKSIQNRTFPHLIPAIGKFHAPAHTLPAVDAAIRTTSYPALA